MITSTPTYNQLIFYIFSHVSSVIYIYIYIFFFFLNKITTIQVYNKRIWTYSCSGFVLRPIAVGQCQYQKSFSIQVSAYQSLHGMIFGRSEVSTTTRRYIESSFTKPPFSRCSIRINMGHPDAMFISFLPGR